MSSGIYNDKRALLKLTGDGPAMLMQVSPGLRYFAETVWAARATKVAEMSLYITNMETEIQAGSKFFT